MNKELLPNFGIAPKLVLLTCIVLSGATAIVGTLLHRSYVRSLHDIEVKHLTSKAADFASRIKTTVQESREKAARIARSPIIHGLDYNDLKKIRPDQQQQLDQQLMNELRSMKIIQDISIVSKTPNGFKEIAKAFREGPHTAPVRLPVEKPEGFMPFDPSAPIKLPSSPRSFVLDSNPNSEAKLIRISAPILDQHRFPIGSVNINLSSARLHKRISNTLRKGEHYHLFYGDGSEFLINPAQEKNPSFTKADLFEIRNSFTSGLAQAINLVDDPNRAKHAIGFSKILFKNPNSEYIYIAFSEEFDKLIAGTSIGSGRAVLAAAATIGVALFAIWYLANRLTHPLRQIAYAARNYNENENAPLPLNATDETGFVAHALQEMRDKIKVRTNALKTEINAHKTTSRNLVIAIRESQQASAAKSSFLAAMSHEIRTPMNGVIGMAELLRQTILSSDQQKLLNTICSSGASLLRIINDILDFSKIESGKMDLENEPFDLIQCIEESAELLSTTAHEKGLELIIDIDSTTPRYIRGDVTRVRQVIANILSNALKFTHEGEVSMQVAPVSRSDKNVSLKFEVSDTGVGISEDQKNKLFEAFSQADTSIARKYGGTGLGLAICHKLTQLMGGRTWVNSELGVGSTFHFTITAELWPAETYLAPLLNPDYISDQEVLIVDSNLRHASALQKLLQAWGLRTSIQSRFENDPQTPRLIIANRPDDVERDNLIDCASKTDTSIIILAHPAETKDEKLEKHPNITTVIKPYSQTRLAAALEHFLKKGEELLADSPVEEPTEPLEQLFKYKALAVDDNPINLFCAQELLKRMGIHADLAHSGREALSLCSDNKYDMIFMDLSMPDMDGLQTTENLLKLYSGKIVPPIIALTANAMPEDRVACKNAGMAGFVAKPVKLDTLRSSIETAVPAFEPPLLKA